MSEDIDQMEEALRVLETILEEAQDWSAGTLVEQLEGAVESLNEAIATASNDDED
jgi:hypothetical protein